MNLSTKKYNSLNECNQREQLSSLLFIIIEIVLYNRFQDLGLNFQSLRFVWKNLQKDAKISGSRLLVNFHQHISQCLRQELGLSKNIFKPFEFKMAQINDPNGDESSYIDDLIYDIDEILDSEPRRDERSNHEPPADAIESFYENNFINRRKNCGEIYTPPDIAKIMVRRSLEHHQKNASEDKKAHHQPDSITLLDPACGGGRFLKDIWESLLEQQSLIDISKLNDSSIQKLADLFGKHIFGYDISPLSVQIARITCFLRICKTATEEYGYRPSKQDLEYLCTILERNICEKDFLLESDETSKFTLILSNPPYVSSKEIEPKYKLALKQRYKTAIRQFDLYTIFLERSLQMLKRGGVACFIIPDSYLGRGQFAESRKKLLNSSKILRIDQITSAFPGISVSNIILMFEKTGSDYRIPNTICFYQFKDLRLFIKNEGDSIRINQQYYEALPKCKFLFVNQTQKEILAGLFSQPNRFGDFIIIHRGEEIGKNSKEIVDRTDRTIDRASKLVTGEDIRKYAIKSDTEYTARYIKKDAIRKEKNKPLYSSRKIMVRQLGDEIYATIDKQGDYVTLQTVYNILTKGESYSLELLLAILNSYLIQFMYELFFKDKQLFPRILLGDIQKIPLPASDVRINQEMKRLVQDILNKSDDTASFKRIRTRIEVIIFKFYKINRKDIAYILHFLNIASDEINEILEAAEM